MLSELFPEINAELCARICEVLCAVKTETALSRSEWRDG